MPEFRKIVKAIMDEKTDRAKYATVHAIDGVSVDIRVDNSSNLIRNVSVVGSVNNIRTGDSVPIYWENGRPFVVALGDNPASSDTGIPTTTDFRDILGILDNNQLPRDIDIPGGLSAGSAISVSDQAVAPAAPPSGKHSIYPKSDGWYQMGPDGVEAKIGEGGTIGDELRIGDLGLLRVTPGISGEVLLTRNAYWDPAFSNWKRIVADGDASMIDMDASSNVTFWVAIDANTAANSVISWGSKFSVDKTGLIGTPSTTKVYNLNADRVDDHHTDTAYNSFGNGTVPVRHSSGYLYTNYLNMTADNSAGAVTRVAAESGSDSYLRWFTPDQIAMASAKGVACSFSVTFDGGGQVIAVGATGQVRLPCNFVPTLIEMVSEETGSIGIAASYGTYSGWSGTLTALTTHSISSSNKSTLSNPGWNFTPAGYYLKFVVSSVSAIKTCTITYHGYKY